MAVAALDRASAVRRALRALVAERGFHGASMSAVAARAGVATGTAYTHYASKDELVIAAYLETKAELAAAAAAASGEGEAGERFRALWLALFHHLEVNRDHALFLLQVDCSPYRARAHEAALARGDALMEAAAAPELASRLQPLPLEVLYELGLAPAIRLAAEGTSLSSQELDAVAAACWRAVSIPG